MAPVSDVAQPVANTGFTNLYQPNENTIVEYVSSSPKYLHWS
jgi:hypothetical protein